jgi:hypothetical protein
VSSQPLVRHGHVAQERHSTRTYSPHLTSHTYSRTHARAHARAHTQSTLPQTLHRTPTFTPTANPLLHTHTHTLVQTPYVVQPKSERDTLSTKYAQKRTSDLLQFSNKVPMWKDQSSGAYVNSFITVCKRRRGCEQCVNPCGWPCVPPRVRTCGFSIRHSCKLRRGCEHRS